jgi:outer membrane murein-binding lipoprotein Lpp
MKRTIAALIILFSMTCAGCGDKEAREYAGKLIPVLTGYQEQLSQKIKAERASYEAADFRYAEAEKLEITVRLESERDARSEQLADEIVSDGVPPPLSKIFAALGEYGARDFETTQSILAAAMNSRSRYLTELESLEAEFQKIKLLKESLGELAKSKKPDMKQFKETAVALMQTQGAVNKLACGELQKQLETLGTEQAAAKNGEKKTIDQNLKRFSDQLLAKNCK